MIHDARQGDYQPALDALGKHLETAPNDRRVLSDYILIGGWAANNQAVIQAFERAGSPGKSLAAKPLSTVARAYRDTQQWDKALDLFAEGERRFPSQAAFRYGRIMTLADAGRTPESLSQGKQLVDLHPDQADAHLALSYAEQMAGRPYAALNQTSQAYDLSPHKPYVIRAYILAQQQAQLPQAALSMAHAHPGVMTPAQVRSLQADIAAQFTRASATEARGEGSRFALADRALAMYDKLIPAWQALGPSAKADAQRLESDRLQALHARRRMQDVVTSYEAMRANGTPVKGYVLGDVAAAYLYMRHPEKAEPLFRQSLSMPAENTEPSNRLADQTGLFYALTESSHYTPANSELQQATKEQPVWLYYKGSPLRTPNPLRLDVDTTRAMGDLYEGNTLGAQARMDEMTGAAPDNANLRTDRAAVYLARELPRHAERELKIAESLSPRDVEVEVRQAETAMALQEWHQARLLRDDVLARAPANLTVQRLDREWQVHNMAEWRVTASRGLSTNSAVTAGHDWNIDTVLYSPPIDENWRAFTGLGYSEGEFDEGNGYYSWARAGVEWRSRDITAQAEVSGNRYGDGTRTGAAVSATYDLNDHWQLGAGAALRSRATPLRALNQGVSANSLNASVRWRGDERREWTLSVTPSFFSDGNNRLEASLDGRQRVYTSPRIKADALLELSASQNTKDDTVYFNPKSDFTVLPALQITHTLYKRYETQWDQQFLVGAGLYSQQGFSSGGIYTLGYGQRYRYNDVLDVGFQVSGTSRPYDGQRERDYNFAITMTYRF